MYRMMDAGFDNSYDGYQGKHINAMPSQFAGTPPYQLSCGSRASLHTASTYKSKSYRGASRHKFISKGKKSGKRVLVAGKGKRAFKAGKSTKITRIALNKRKNIKQSARITHISKSSRTTQSKKIANRPTTGKHRTTIKSTKTNRTRYRHRKNT
jgi:hypothetical protein